VDPTNRFVIVTDLGTDRISVYPFDATNGSLDAKKVRTVASPAGVGPRHVRLHPNGNWLYADTEMGSTISLYDWDSRTGTLTEKQTLSTLPAGFSGKSLAAELRIHPDGRHLYVSNRGDNSLMVFSIDPASGRLAAVQRQPSGGSVPRNFALDPTGRWLVCTHPLTNNVMVFAVDQTTDRLTPVGTPIKILAPYGIEFCPSPWVGPWRCGQG
jgi:6-phosphogluconolactonase